MGPNYGNSITDAVGQGRENSGSSFSQHFHAGSNFFGSLQAKSLTEDIGQHRWECLKGGISRWCEVWAAWDGSTLWALWIHTEKGAGYSCFRGIIAHRYIYTMLLNKPFLPTPVCTCQFQKYGNDISLAYLRTAMRDTPDMAKLGLACVSRIRWVRYACGDPSPDTPGRCVACMFPKVLLGILQLLRTFLFPSSCLVWISNSVQVRGNDRFLNRDNWGNHYFDL